MQAGFRQSAGTPPFAFRRGCRDILPCLDRLNCAWLQPTAKRRVRGEFWLGSTGMGFRVAPLGLGDQALGPGDSEGAASAPDIPDTRQKVLPGRLRLVTAGEALAKDRERQAAGAASECDWAGIADALSA